MKQTMKQKKDAALPWALFTAFAIVAVFVMCMGYAALAWMAWQNLNDVSRDSSARQNRASKALLEAKLATMDSALRLAAAPFSEEPKRGETAGKSNEAFGSDVWMRELDAEGRLITGQKGARPADFSGLSYFKELKDSTPQTPKAFSLSSLHLDQLTERPSLVMARPIYSSSGRFSGAAAAVVRPQILALAASTGLADGGWLAIYDTRDGKLLADFPKGASKLESWGGCKVAERDSSICSPIDPYPIALVSGFGSGKWQREAKGQMVMAAAFALASLALMGAGAGWLWRLHKGSQTQMESKEREARRLALELSREISEKRSMKGLANLGLALGQANMDLARQSAHFKNASESLLGKLSAAQEQGLLSDSGGKGEPLVKAAWECAESARLAHSLSKACGELAGAGFGRHSSSSGGRRDLGKLVEAGMRAVEPYLRKGGFNGMARWAGPDGVLWRGDPAPLLEIVCCLAINAREHGFAGRSKGEFQATLWVSKTDAGEVAMLRFKDDGNGVDPSRMALMQERLSSGVSDGGLGLSAKLAKEELGAQLRLVEAGSGATVFELALPLDSIPKSRDLHDPFEGQQLL